MSKGNLFKLPSLGVDEHVHRIMTYQSIGVEGLGDMLNSVVDGAKATFSNIINFTSERAYKEAIDSKFAVIRALKGLDNTQLASINVLVPDRLTGSMNAIIEDVTYAYDSFTSDLMRLIDGAIVDLSVSITAANDPEDLFLPPSSVVASRKLEVKRKTLQDKLSKHFNAKSTRNLSPLLDHFRGAGDIREMYSLLMVCEDSIRKVTMGELLGKSEKISQNVDAIISKAEGMGDNLKITSSTRETTEVLYNLGKGLEFVGYLQAVVLQIYASIEDIGDKITRLG